MEKKEAMKILKDFHDKSALFSVRTALHTIIPELRKSEDNMIKEELIKHLKEGVEGYMPAGGSEDYARWLAWVEKQGEQKPADKYNIRGIKSKHAEGKLGEMIKNLKSADKIEPKFHEGNWIVYEENIYQIHNISLKKYYECLRTDGTVHIFDFEYIDSKSHIWTIADAKPGDVLFLDLMEGKTFIYNGVNPDMAILYSFIISNDGKDVLPYRIGKPNTGIGNIEESKNIIYPATKEQRDKLEKAMADAGWEFDFEKKELKKIKQKPAAWSEEDKARLDEVIRHLEGAVLSVTDIEWLKSLRPQNTWKPSEEQMEALKTSYLYWKGVTKKVPYTEELESLYEQLKKLKC